MELKVPMSLSSASIDGSEDSEEDCGNGDGDGYSSDGTGHYTDTSTRSRGMGEMREIIQAETQGVIMWREIVTGMLVITTCFVTVMTYIFLLRQEVDDFTNGVS
jgi:hypothetical protein